MDTFFSPSERCSGIELRKELDFASHNPIINGIMASISGLLMVLDEYRQIIALNQEISKIWNIDDVDNILGIRLGEFLQCIHAHDDPSGCGTTRYCPTCGAAIAIAGSIETNKPVEKICAISAIKNGQPVDLSFQVRSFPITFESYRFILLFMQDITTQQTLASLEKVFFHDLNNILTALVGASEILNSKKENTVKKHAELIKTLVQRLIQEVEMQRVLACEGDGKYHVVIQNVTGQQIIHEIEMIFMNHPVAVDKTLVIPRELAPCHIKTDLSLLIRILTNMIKNAFEAAPKGGKVKFWIEPRENRVTFQVWNQQYIPDDIALRIFQRHFSTKSGGGRGLGTYSMKLFGEKYLNGSVSFESTLKNGTTFSFILPG